MVVLIVKTTASESVEELGGESGELDGAETNKRRSSQEFKFTRRKLWWEWKDEQQTAAEEEKEKNSLPLSILFLMAS